MIFDSIENAGRYCGLHHGFKAAFAFINTCRLSLPADGRHVISGDRLYAIVARTAGKGAKAARLEAHRAFIDIQYVVAGIDSVGIKPLAKCVRPSGSFDDSKDIGFYEDRPASRIRVTAGEFAIFFPEDAHAPLSGTGELVKIVVKIACDEDV